MSTTSSALNHSACPLTLPQPKPRVAPGTTPSSKAILPSDPVASKSPTLPVRVGFIVSTFTFGGSETEVIELVAGANSELLRFVGVAVQHPRALPAGEPPCDGSFPPIYLPQSRWTNSSDPRVTVVPNFASGVKRIVGDADVVVTWGVTNLCDYLPTVYRPEIVVLSKDSGEWARGFLHSCSLLTRHHVANSTLAGSVFPEWARPGVRVIYNGVNPSRVTVRTPRHQQRLAWGLSPGEKVVGYLGRIEADKGMGRTVEGLARLPAEWKAVFIGANPNARYVDELRLHCEQKIPGRYRILDWCHDIGSALGALDVFCHPSDHEGFSNSIAEAWLAGVPTIYTAGTGAIPDLGDLGIPVPPGASGEIMAAAIRQAYRNEKLISKARTIIQKEYLVEHYIQRWTGYLLGLCRTQRPTRVLLVLSEENTIKLGQRLVEFMGALTGVDFCGIGLAGDPLCAPAELWIRIVKQHRCPLFSRLHSPTALKTIIAQTRPDVLLLWDGSENNQFANGFIPVLRIPSATLSPDHSQIQSLDALAKQLRRPNIARHFQTKIIGSRHALTGLTYTTKIDPSFSNYAKCAPNIRFAIVGNPRTGSSYLASLLDSHTEIASWDGEVFDPGDAFEKSRYDDPESFLRQGIFQVKAHAVGFKFLAEALRSVRGSWELLNRLGIRLLHCTRRNLLDAYLSFLLARQNNAFTCFHGEYRNQRLEIDPAHFVEWAEYSEECDEMIRNEAIRRAIPRLEITYEWLPSELAKILSFLEVRQERLSSGFRKQRSARQSEIISNYQTAKKTLRNTRWARFFEE